MNKPKKTTKLGRGHIFDKTYTKNRKYNNLGHITYFNYDKKSHYITIYIILKKNLNVTND